MARLYDLAAWRGPGGLRARVLARDPLCKDCERRGVTRASEVVDHIEPHRGDLTLFLAEENCQGLCAPCHDRHKQAEECNGYSDRISADGWPADKRHPVNGTMPAQPRRGVGSKV